MRATLSHLTNDDARYLSHLRAESLATLKVALRGHTEVAFVGLPSHRNLGDSMIAAGTMAYLRQLGVRIRYLSDIYTFDRAVLAGLPASTPILFHGGGNLGDLYPREERFRLDVIAQDPDRHYILLPQTVHFEQAESIDHSRAGYAIASDLTILVRDKPSEAFSHKHFGHSEVLWSPDHALGWTPPVPFRVRDRELVVVARLDGESRPQDRGRCAADWSYGRTNALGWRVAEGAKSRLQKLHQGSSARRVLPALVRAETLLNLRAARAVASRARVLATNRLHAHILAVLCGIPHSVTDNNYGKVSSIFDEYTGGFTTASWSPSLAAAIDRWG